MPFLRIFLVQRERASFRASGQQSGRFDFGLLARDTRRAGSLPSLYGRICGGFRHRPDLWPARPDLWPWAGAPIAEGSSVDNKNLIAVRYVKAAGRTIPVHFFRNDGGSVAGRFMLDPKDTPILDGPNPE